MVIWRQEEQQCKVYGCEVSGSSRGTETEDDGGSELWFMAAAPVTVELTRCTWSWDSIWISGSLLTLREWEIWMWWCYKHPTYLLVRGHCCHRHITPSLRSSSSQSLWRLVFQSQPGQTRKDLSQRHLPVKLCEYNYKPIVILHPVTDQHYCWMYSFKINISFFQPQE